MHEQDTFHAFMLGHAQTDSECHRQHKLSGAYTMTLIHSFVTLCIVISYNVHDFDLCNNSFYVCVTVCVRVSVCRLAFVWLLSNWNVQTCINGM